MKLLKKYQHVWIVPVYGIFYLWAFQYLEQRNVKAHIIHLKLDDMIPFCEYFIIPYLMWFLYIALTVGYFAFINKNKQEYYQLIFTLGLGMTLFLVVSYFYPNGQDLRPHLTGDGFFISLVRHLYRIDTPTNILPSIHVFNSVACCIAICRHCVSIFICESLRLLILLFCYTISPLSALCKEKSAYCHFFPQADRSSVCAYVPVAAFALTTKINTKNKNRHTSIIQIPSNTPLTPNR